MARLPDAQALGERPSPSPRGGIISGPSNAGLGETVQAQNATKGVTEFADQLAQASDRIMTREETVERARAYGEYENAAANELRRLSTEGDFSKLSTTRQYGEFLTKKRDEILSAHQGRGDSQAMLSARLESYKARFADHAAAEGLKAQEKLVTDTLGKSFNSITDRAMRTNERLDNLFAEADLNISDMGPAIPGADKLKFSRIAKEQIGLARFNQILDAGGYGEAKKLRDSMPQYGEIFGAAAQQHINHRISTIEQKILDESTKGYRDAINKITEARIIAGAAAANPNDENFLRKLGLKPEKESEFLGLVSELTRLEETGQKGTMRYNLVADRVARLTSDTGFSVEFNQETGQFSVSQGKPRGSPTGGGLPGQPSGVVGGGASLGTSPGLGQGLTPSQALPQSEKLDNLDKTLSTLDASIAAIKEDPTRAGVFGSVRRFAQTALGVGSDVGSMVEKATGIKITDLGASAQKSIANDSSIPKDVKNALVPYFDPKLSQMEIWENTLALELAKLRILSGNSPVRALAEAFRAAKQDVGMTGLSSSDQVLTRLETVRKEFDVEREKMKTRLGGTPQQRKNLDEELNRIFGRK